MGAEDKKQIEAFLRDLNILADDFNTAKLLEDYLEEIEEGLTSIASSSLAMIPTYISPLEGFGNSSEAGWETEGRCFRTVALDAGGSNLRAAFISFSADGKSSVDRLIKGPMPGLGREMSSWDFLLTIAEFVAPLLEEYYELEGKPLENLGFCFSYNTKVTLEQGGAILDGVLLGWSKEVKVPELVGKSVGKSLLEVFEKRYPEYAPGSITLINDSVATLLAGQTGSDNVRYSDYIGYILGTGMNSCYTEDTSAFGEVDPLYREARMSVNMESGNYARFPRSPLDKLYDAQTLNPNVYLQEKSCSGRYLGELMTVLLREAAQADLLPGCFRDLPLQDTVSMNRFLTEPTLSLLDFSKAPFHLWLLEQNVDGRTLERVFWLIDALVERAALFTAVNLAACILRCGRGLSPISPICLEIDGSTYYLLYRFPERLFSWLKRVLPVERYYRTRFMQEGPLIGAAIASLKKRNL